MGENFMKSSLSIKFFFTALVSFVLILFIIYPSFAITINIEDQDDVKINFNKKITLDLTNNDFLFSDYSGNLKNITNGPSATFCRKLSELDDEIISLLNQNRYYFSDEYDVVEMYKDYVSNGYDWDNYSWEDIELAINKLPHKLTIFDAFSNNGYSNEQTIELYNKLIELSYHAKYIKTNDEELAKNNALKTLFLIGQAIAGTSFHYGLNNFFRCNFFDEMQCYDLVGLVMLLKVTHGNIRALLELNGGELMYEVSYFKHNYPVTRLNADCESLAIFHSTQHVFSPIEFYSNNNSDKYNIVRVFDTASGKNHIAERSISSLPNGYCVTDLSQFQDECSTILKWTIRHQDEFDTMHSILSITNKLDAYVIGDYTKRLKYSRKLIYAMQDELDGVSGRVIPGDVYTYLDTGSSGKDIMFAVINGERKALNYYWSSRFNPNSNSNSDNECLKVVDELYYIDPFKAEKYSDDEFWSDFEIRYSDWDNLDEELMKLFFQNVKSI